MTITINHETEDSLHETCIADILHYVAHTIEYHLSAATLRRDSFDRTRHIPGVGSVTFSVTK